ncbi:MAG: tetratricopeptide repeat protein [Candidatus Limnocylindrales bacterium]|jgi:hypothetical protein
MFEVLLRADKALASGALDQAERSYWQLVELDPTNAIAVAGLARVSLERGDRRLARTFADRALAMDPESVAAKRILEALKEGATEAPDPDNADLPLLAAQRLEALGRRRAAARKSEGDVGAQDPGGKPGTRVKADVDDAGKALPQLPEEPLRERRQAGREAAAAGAAKAEAAPRPQAPPRPKTHQALGDRARRNLLPEDVKPKAWADDPFAAAESAAAIEAVDETDDVVIEERVGRTGRARATADARFGEVLGDVEATTEDESIAMRVALVADAAELDAATFEAAEMDAADVLATPEAPSPEVEDVLGVAELVAAEELGPAPSRRIDLAALEADLRAAELRVAEREAAGDDAEAELAAAELASAQLATAELASEQIAEAELEAAELDVLAGPRKPPVPPAAPSPAAEEATEEDAEAAALREAVAMVLGGDASGPGETGGAAETGAEGPAWPPARGRSSTSGGSRPSTAEPSAGHDTHAKPAAESAEPADTGAITEPRRKGLLRRFRGD